MQIYTQKTPQLYDALHIPNQLALTILASFVSTDIAKGDF